MSNVTPPSGYLVPQPPDGPTPARPGTVSLSSVLLYLLALLSLIAIGLYIYQTTFMDHETLTKIYQDAGYRADQAGAQATGAVVAVYIAAAVALVFGVLYALLAIFVNRGKQWARITTWVIAGLSVCCGAFGLVGTAFQDALTGMASTAGIDQKKIVAETSALLPSWLEPTVLVVGILSLIASILVIVLLMLPPSNPFFRKPEPAWTPPTYPAP